MEVDPYDLGNLTPSSLSSISPSFSNSGGDSGISSSANRMRKNKEDKICGVCGDRALGYNFDAISCESCKAFFRRNAPKGLDYFKCPYDEKCKMDISNRRFCKRCRLKKCFEIGMRKEYILTEDEKKRKRQKIEENRTTATRKDRPADQFTSRAAVQKDMHAHDVEMTVTGSWGDLNSGKLIRELERQGVFYSDEPSSQTRTLSQEELVLVGEVHEAYQASLAIKVDKDPPRDQAAGMGDLVNIAEVSVRRVIDMAKKIKSFKLMPQSDQISLLKGGSIELLILRSVLSYDREKQQFLEPGDNVDTMTMTTEQLAAAEGGLFEDHMKFVRHLAVDLRADQTTLILLLVISLFSPDRPNLIDKNQVCYEQEKYSMLLKHHLESAYPYAQARAMYPKLLMKLVDIRNLNEEHSQVLLKVNPEGIQPLMQEVLDLKDAKP